MVHHSLLTSCRKHWVMTELSVSCILIIMQHEVNVKHASLHTQTQKVKAKASTQPQEVTMLLRDLHTLANMASPCSLRVREKIKLKLYLVSDCKLVRQWTYGYCIHTAISCRCHGESECWARGTNVLFIYIYIHLQAQVVLRKLQNMRHQVTSGEWYQPVT